MGGRGRAAHFRAYPGSFQCHEQAHLVTVTQSLSCQTAISHFERLNLAGQKMRKIPNPDCHGKHLSEANTTRIHGYRVRKQEANLGVVAPGETQVTP